VYLHHMTYFHFANITETLNMIWMRHILEA
jgi:hypothetical protein